MMLCTDCAVLSGPNNVHVSQQQTNAQSKGLGTFNNLLVGMQSKARKFYDCILGNDETCSPDEIMVIRAVVFIVILAVYAKANAFREARRLAEGRQRIRTRINSPLTHEDLERIRQQFTDEGYEQEFFDGDAPSFSSGLAQVMANSLNDAMNGSDEHITEVPDAFIGQVVQTRQEFFAQYKNKNVPVSCFVCCQDDFSANSSDLGNVPCVNTHVEGLCIGCLAKIIFCAKKKNPPEDPECPLCRNVLPRLLPNDER